MCNKTLIIVFIFFTTISWTASTLVEECKNATPKPIHVVIEGCDMPPCSFKRGDQALISMNFTAPEDVNEMEAKLSIKYTNLDINYNLPQPDGCKGLINTHCPLEVNEPAIYKLDVPIKVKLQKGLVTATFTMLYNKVQKELVCFKVKCHITD